MRASRVSGAEEAATAPAEVPTGVCPQIAACLTRLVVRPITLFNGYRTV